ncbi:acyl-CoA synthetase [Bailinhaonella thermotolerans]|uniref:AMP-dependent synthetase n=1 Tax=Bailinhaonella thermotolerans TaxID=1070861 RepID=A0A3A4A8L9_9ACTN|nr:long-chain fatty acid--CoA ligase [Bailinhaonella thermotolerans]RJL23277.1 AMP-dependent synthetase [Bailinhaonella thermotolerans]
MNLGSYLTRSTLYWPEREALVCGDRRWTYRELEAAANRLASALLARGVSPGEAVATFAANRGEAVETEMALYKGGFLRVPINARLAPEEVRHILAEARVRVLFTDPERAGQARDAVRRAGVDCAVVDYAEDYPALLAEGDERPVAVEVREDDPAVLNFTSGSTGRLKAAVQTQGNRLANMRKLLMNPDGAFTDQERYLAAGPVTHAAGMVLLAALSRGAAVVVLPRWDAGLFLRTVEAERVTGTLLVPLMLSTVLAHPAVATTDLSSLTRLTVGGAPVSPNRLRQAVEVFGPIVAQGYGLGETTSAVTVLTRQDVLTGVTSDPELLLSCGRAVFDTEVRVVGQDGEPVPPGTHGEVVVRGPDCVREYWNEPELSAETFRDGWVHTGDIGYLRRDGYLFIVDRKKDMIISGGFNVYSSEVEAVLYDHPAVAEACVVGVPDDTWGEAVKAVVVPRPGAEVTARDLIDFCGGRLSGVKKPKSVDFVAFLPVNRNGKIDRRAVREPYWSGSVRNVH